MEFYKIYLLVCILCTLGHTKPNNDDGDPERIVLRNSIIYHFAKNVKTVETDIIVSRKIELGPMTNGLLLLQEVQARIQNLCVNIPEYLKKAKEREVAFEMNKPIFHHIPSAGRAEYETAEKRCEALGLQLPEIYNGHLNQEFMLFMRENNLGYSHVGHYYDPLKGIHRFKATGYPIWTTYQKQVYQLNNVRDSVKLENWTTALKYVDAKFLYTQKGEFLVYHNSLLLASGAKVQDQ